MNLATMGLSSTHQPHAYVHGLSLAPEPKHKSFRRMVARDLTPPTEHADPAMRQQAGAIIGGMASAAVQLDHCARRLEDLGQMQHKAKQLLSIVLLQTDKLIEASQRQFGATDGSAAIALSGVLGQAAELLLQLTPEQIKASLHHMNNMAKLNAAYVPAPVPTDYHEPKSQAA